MSSEYACLRCTGYPGRLAPQHAPQHFRSEYFGPRRHFCTQISSHCADLSPSSPPLTESFQNFCTLCFTRLYRFLPAAIQILHLPVTNVGCKLRTENKLRICGVHLKPTPRCSPLVFVDLAVPAKLRRTLFSTARLNLL